MYINLSGLNILVTGAGKGIGKAIATKLAGAGAAIGVYYNESTREAESLTSILENQSRPFQADLSKMGEASKLFERVSLEMGSVEILINNAGVAIPSKMDATEDDWLGKWNKTMMVI